MSDSRSPWQVPGSRHDGVLGARSADLSDDERAVGAAAEGHPTPGDPPAAPFARRDGGRAGAMPYGAVPRSFGGGERGARTDDGTRPQVTAAEWRRRIDAAAGRPADDGFSFWRQPERDPRSGHALAHGPSPASGRDPEPATGAPPGPEGGHDADPGPRASTASPIRESPTHPSLTPPGGKPSGLTRPQADPRPAAQQDLSPSSKPAEDKPSRPKRRDPYLDNVKFILIALVVMGHSLVPTLDADSARSAYVFIYTFHMPAFVLISGYLSRNFWHSNAKINKLVDTLLIPYVVVEVGYALLRFALGQKWSMTIIDPAWLNWYLVALVLWRISTPVWTRMRQPFLIAVALYLAAGFSEISGDFSIDRFFGLLPFYVLGLLLKPEYFDYLNHLWVKVLAVLTLAGAGVVAILIAPHVSLKPLYYKNSYAKMGMEWYTGMGVRVALLVAALVMTAAVLALVPRRETWFSDLGTRTLYAYLLHGVPVLIAKDQGWLSLPWLYGPLGALAIMTSCFALAILLCLPETRAVFKWAFEPRLTWLYRRPSG